MIIGIYYFKIYLEPIFKFENHLTLYRTKLPQSNTIISCCIACPIDLYEPANTSNAQGIMNRMLHISSHLSQFMTQTSFGIVQMKFSEM